MIPQGKSLLLNTWTAMKNVTCQEETRKMETTTSDSTEKLASEAQIDEIISSQRCDICLS